LKTPKLIAASAYSVRASGQFGLKKWQGQQASCPVDLGPCLCRGHVTRHQHPQHSPSQPQPPAPAGRWPDHLYRYDSEGRLESASTGQGEGAPTTKYAHNALGQRVFKTEPLYSGTQSSGSTSSKTGKNLNNLLADDEGAEPAQAEQPGLVQWLLGFWSKLWSPGASDAEKLGFSYVYAEDGSLLGEYGSGGSNSTGTAQYIDLPTVSGPMPIAAVVKGQTYAVHSDHLNTPRKLTQADGQTAWQAYSAFGDEQPTTAAKRFTSETITPTTGSTGIPEVQFNLRYPGQYFDQETKLHYNWNRSYRPADGTYTQGDPIGLDGGFNRYSYVAGDPLGFADDEGLQRRAGGPATLTWGQAQLNFQGKPYQSDSAVPAELSVQLCVGSGAGIYCCKYWAVAGHLATASVYTKLHHKPHCSRYCWRSCI
jgi:RHS repeat-associated protein